MAGVVGGTLATIIFFYVWWIVLYLVSPIIVAANVQMSGEEGVNLMLALALVSGAITAVAIFVVSGR